MENILRPWIWTPPRSMILVDNSFSCVLEMIRQRLRSLQSVAQFFSVTGLITTSWLTDPQLYRLFVYLKLLLPNDEDENTNVSVIYFGFEAELKLGHENKIKDVSFLMADFQSYWISLDCWNPPSIASCRINSQSSKTCNQISCVQSGKVKAVS